MKLLERLAVVLLRPVLVVLMLLLLMLQTLSFPGEFRHMAEQSPQDANLRWPFTIIAGILLLCLELVVFSVWKLLTLVKSKKILTSASRKWMNLIISAIATAWLIIITIAAFVVWDADDPGVAVMLFFIQSVVAVIGLVAIVLRGVFLDAINQK